MNVSLGGSTKLFLHLGVIVILMFAVAIRVAYVAAHGETAWFTFLGAFALLGIELRAYLRN